MTVQPEYIADTPAFEPEADASEIAAEKLLELALKLLWENPEAWSYLSLQRWLTERLDLFWRAR